MNLKAQLVIIAIAFAAAGVYVHFFSEPACQRIVAKLQAATTNEVAAALGRPFKIVEATNFTARADELSDEGFPISNADMTAEGSIWLYQDGRVGRTSVRIYQTVFFNQSNRVCKIYRTYWAKDPWMSKPD